MTNTTQKEAQPSRECLQQSDLHAEIMSLHAIPTDDAVSTMSDRDPLIAYKMGYRDARHDAAELAAALQAAPPAPAAVAVTESHTQALKAIAEWPVTDMLLNMDAANMRGIAQRALAAAPAQAVAVPEGWRWMTHPDRNNGQPIPVRIEVEDGVTYYRPFDEHGTDFEWDKRSDSWVEIATPAQEHATQLAGQGLTVPRQIGEIRIKADGHPYARLSTAFDDAGNGWAEGTPFYAAAPAQAQEDARDAESAGRTDAEIVEQTEELAKFLLAWKWGLAPESASLMMRNSQNTKAQKAWNAACEIQELLTATDVENAVSEVDDAARAAQGGAA